MKQVILLTVLTIFLFPKSSDAQWSEVSFYNRGIRHMITIGDTMFVVGRYTFCNGATSYHLSMWDGTTMTNYPTNPGEINNGIFSAANFNDTLWVGCSYTFNSNWGIAYRAGGTWQDGGGSHLVAWRGSYVDGNDLYLSGFNGRVTKKTGSGAWTDLPSTDSTFDQIWAIDKFSNEIVVAGDIVTANSVPVENICSYNGSAWQPLGAGVDSTVYTLVIYNGELYAGGVFENAGGNAAKSIAKWNGTAWSNVGGSVTGTGVDGIKDLLVYGDRLYACGDFDEIGGVSANGLAYWDGSNWNDVGFPALSNGYPRAMEVYNYSLYVGTDEGLSVLDTSHIYSQPLPVIGMEDGPSKESLLIYPNPANDVVTIQTESALLGVQVYDQAGRLVLASSTIGSTYYQVDIAVLEAGIYLFQCLTENGIVMKKIIKE